MPQRLKSERLNNAHELRAEMIETVASAENLELIPVVLYNYATNDRKNFETESNSIQTLEKNIYALLAERAGTIICPEYSYTFKNNELYYGSDPVPAKKQFRDSENLLVNTTFNARRKAENDAFELIEQQMATAPEGSIYIEVSPTEDGYSKKLTSSIRIGRKEGNRLIILPIYLPVKSGAESLESMKRFVALYRSDLQDATCAIDIISNPTFFLPEPNGLFFDETGRFSIDKFRETAKNSLSTDLMNNKEDLQLIEETKSFIQKVRVVSLGNKTLVQAYLDSIRGEKHSLSSVEILKLILKVQDKLTEGWDIEGLKGYLSPINSDENIKQVLSEPVYVNDNELGAGNFELDLNPDVGERRRRDAENARRGAENNRAQTNRNAIPELTADDQQLPLTIDQEPLQIQMSPFGSFTFLPTFPNPRVSIDSIPTQITPEQRPIQFPIFPAIIFIQNSRNEPLTPPNQIVNVDSNEKDDPQVIVATKAPIPTPPDQLRAKPSQSTGNDISNTTHKTSNVSTEQSSKQDRNSNNVENTRSSSIQSTNITTTETSRTNSQTTGSESSDRTAVAKRSNRSRINRLKSHTRLIQATQETKAQGKNIDRNRIREVKSSSSSSGKSIHDHLEGLHHKTVIGHRVTATQEETGSTRFKEKESTNRDQTTTALSATKSFRQTSAQSAEVITTFHRALQTKHNLRMKKEAEVNILPEEISQKLSAGQLQNIMDGQAVLIDASTLSLNMAQFEEIRYGDGLRIGGRFILRESDSHSGFFVITKVKFEQVFKSF